MKTTPELLRNLGVFYDREFLDPDLRVTLVEEVLAGGRKAAAIEDRGGKTVEESKRRTKTARVSAETRAAVGDRFASMAPELQSHFGIELGGSENPNFLVYEEGDFFRTHTDSAHSDVPEYVRERKVSAVVFLNERSDTRQPGAYGGGSLVLYGLLPAPGGKVLGLPVPAIPGAFVAFKSDVAHEVQAVTHGERYTIVNWFF